MLNAKQNTTRLRANLVFVTYRSHFKPHPFLSSHNEDLWLLVFNCS